MSCHDHNHHSSCDCSNACPPSPIPPWNRPVQSPQTQTLYGDGDVSLMSDVTYLDQVTPKNGSQFYSIALPDGNYLRQIKRVYVKDSNQNTTFPFQMSGHFVGFSALRFNNVAWSAVLEWGGSAWYLISGNCEQIV